MGATFITIDRDMPFPVRVDKGWEATIHTDSPTVQHVGIEHLTIEFKHTMFGAHWSDKWVPARLAARQPACLPGNVPIHSHAVAAWLTCSLLLEG